MKSANLLIPVAVCVTAAAAAAVVGEPALATAQRPFYIIAHMANSIANMDDFIMEGANAMEVDVQFTPSGTAVELYHGVPCDAFRSCIQRTPFVDYLEAAAARPMALLFLDLKIASLNEAAMRSAGIDLARDLVDHFWRRGGGLVSSVVLCVPYTRNRPLLESFIGELRKLDPSKLQQVSYDVSEDQDLEAITRMYNELNITAAWQGDGITNWFETLRSLKRVVNAMKLRDQGNTPLKKVYRWTVDRSSQLRRLISMGVDGVITNRPDRAREILKEFDNVRLATPLDSINERFQG